MNTLDFTLCSFVLGSTLFLADSMISQPYKREQKQPVVYVYNVQPVAAEKTETLIRTVKTPKMDESYIKEKLKRQKSVKEEKERMARIKSIKACKKNKECEVLAEAIYFEGRGESVKGQIAVGQVIKKRVELKNFPNSIKEVVYHERVPGVCQFSYVCDIRNGVISGEIEEPLAMEKSFELAYGVMHNKYPNYSKGADHYFNPKKVVQEPYWVPKMTHVASIDNHVFLAEHLQIASL